MNIAKKDKIIGVLKMIAEDAKNDATVFDGQPFTGKTVGTYFGNHGASIASLATILQEVLEDTPI